MTWTIEALYREHPLPEGWGWELWENGDTSKYPVAQRPDGTYCAQLYGERLVAVDSSGEYRGAPADVALAVLLANKAGAPAADETASLRRQLEHYQQEARRAVAVQWATAHDSVHVWVDEDSMHDTDALTMRLSELVVQTQLVAASACIESIRERPLDERDRAALVRWLVDACEVALHNCEVLLCGDDVVGQLHRTPERDQQLVGIVRDELLRLGVAEHVNVVLVFDEVGLTGLKAQARDERLRDDVLAEAERRDEEMEAPVAVQLLRDLRFHLIYAAIRSSQCAELIDRLTLALARAGALT